MRVYLDTAINIFYSDPTYTHATILLYIEYSGRFWTVIPEAQYRDSALMDTAILGIEYRDSGQRIPIFFIMYPYALKRKYITKEVIVYDQVSRDHPAIRIRS